MDRDALDAFFAEAEDVLTDWHGSLDSMHVETTAGPALPSRRADITPHDRLVALCGTSFSPEVARRAWLEYHRLALEVRTPSAVLYLGSIA